MGLRRVGDILVQAKAISETVRDRVLLQQQKSRGRFGTNFLEIGAGPEGVMLRALTVKHQVAPAHGKDLVEIRPDIIRLVPTKLAARLHLIPFNRLGRNVHLAMRDPKDLAAVDEIAFLTGLAITPCVALELRLSLALEKHYGIASETRFKDLASKIDAGAPATPSQAPTPPAPAPPAERVTGRVAPLTSARPATPAAVTPPAMPPPAMTPLLVTPPAVTPAVATPTRPTQPLPPPPQSTSSPARKELSTGAFDKLVSPGTDPWGVEDEIPSVPEPSLWTETTGSGALSSPLQASPQAPPSPDPDTVPVRPPPSEDIIYDEIVAPSRTKPEVREPATAPAGPSQSTAQPSPPSASRKEIVPVPPAQPGPSETAPAPAEEPVAQIALDLASRLSSAESRDDIAEGILETACQRYPRAALFIVQTDRVIGWAARPEPPEGLRSFSVAFAEPSVFAALRNTDGFYAGPGPDLPANRSTLAALGAEWPTTIAVVPVSLKSKSVLFLLVDAGPLARPPSIPDLKRLATMTATSLEILLLKNRLRNLQSSE